MEVWREVIEQLTELVGREEALNESDRNIDELLGIGDDYEGEIPTTEEAISSLSDADFEKLIGYLKEEIGIQNDIKSDRAWFAEKERLKTEITVRESELCFEWGLSKRQAQVVARREHEISTEEIMREFDISAQAVSDAYTKGKQKLIMTQNELESD